MKRVAVALAAIVGIASVTAQQQKSTDISAQTPVVRSDLELRLIANEFRDGLPQSFTFVVKNTSDHPVFISLKPSPCSGIDGTVNLAVIFTSGKDEATGTGGGCGSNGGHPPILERLKSWKRLERDESLSVTYLRSLFPFPDSGNALGTYDVWGTYDSPELTAEDISTLERAGIAFPRQKLTSNHLHFDTTAATRTHK